MCQIEHMTLYHPRWTLPILLVAHIFARSRKIITKCETYMHVLSAKPLNKVYYQKSNHISIETEEKMAYTYCMVAVVSSLLVIIPGFQDNSTEHVAYIL